MFEVVSIDQFVELLILTDLELKIAFKITQLNALQDNSDKISSKCNSNSSSSRYKH